MRTYVSIGNRKKRQKREKESAQSRHQSVLSVICSRQSWSQRLCVYDSRTAASTTQKILVISVTRPQSNFASSISFIQGYWWLVCILLASTICYGISSICKIILYTKVKLANLSMVTIFNCMWQQTLERESNWHNKVLHTPNKPPHDSHKN